MRTEHDFLGSLEVPDDVYYGVQTMRAIENFRITGQKLDPDFIVALAQVKKAAALANMDTGRLPHEIGDVLVRAADEVIAGEMFDQFPIDPIQGGAGTSINMNMNEVLCNRALELRGEEKGRYDIISPNNHANMAQSTNDAFPTGIKVCLSAKGSRFVASLDRLAAELERKATAYRGILKMGRTHLQDAVPITLGQEMGSYASAVRRSIRRIRYVLRHIHTINMGGTAVGTGLNAEPAYIKAVAKRLSEVTGEQYRTSQNIIDATNNTDAFADGARPHQACQRFPPYGIGTALRAERAAFADASAGLVHHAGQGEPRHRGGARSGVLSGDRRRSRRHARRGKRAVRAERDGAGDGVQHVQLAELPHARGRYLRRETACRSHTERRSVSKVA